MRNTNRPLLAGSWDTQTILLVLGNNLARAAVQGRPCPIAERVYERLSATVTS